MKGRFTVRRLLAPLLLSAAALCASTGCTSDERWEGSLSGCSTAAFNDVKVLLVLDTPRPPEPSGWFGKGGSDSDGTWSITEIEDAVGPFNGITFKAEFVAGSLRESWDVELSGTPASMEGEVEIEQSLGVFGTSTVKCDVEVKREG